MSRDLTCKESLSMDDSAERAVPSRRIYAPPPQTPQNYRPTFQNQGTQRYTAIPVASRGYTVASTGPPTRFMSPAASSYSASPINQQPVRYSANQQAVQTNKTVRSNSMSQSKGPSWNVAMAEDNLQQPFSIGQHSAFNQSPNQIIRHSTTALREERPATAHTSSSQVSTPQYCINSTRLTPQPKVTPQQASNTVLAMAQASQLQKDRERASLAASIRSVYNMHHIHQQIQLPRATNSTTTTRFPSVAGNNGNRIQQPNVVRPTPSPSVQMAPPMSPALRAFSSQMNMHYPNNAIGNSLPGSPGPIGMHHQIVHSTPSPRPSILRKNTTPGSAAKRLQFDGNPSTSMLTNGTLNPAVRNIIQTANDATNSIAKTLGAVAAGNGQIPEESPRKRQRKQQFEIEHDDADQVRVAVGMEALQHKSGKLSAAAQAQEKKKRGRPPRAPGFPPFDFRLYPTTFSESSISGTEFYPPGMKPIFVPLDIKKEVPSPTETPKVNSNSNAQQPVPPPAQKKPRKPRGPNKVKKEPPPLLEMEIKQEHREVPAPPKKQAKVVKPTTPTVATNKPVVSRKRARVEEEPIITNNVPPEKPKRVKKETAALLEAVIKMEPATEETKTTPKNKKNKAKATPKKAKAKSPKKKDKKKKKPKKKPVVEVKVPKGCSRVVPIAIAGTSTEDQKISPESNLALDVASFLATNLTRNRKEAVLNKKFRQLARHGQKDFSFPDSVRQVDGLDVPCVKTLNRFGSIRANHFRKPELIGRAMTRQRYWRTLAMFRKRLLNTQRRRIRRVAQRLVIQGELSLRVFCRKTGVASINDLTAAGRKEAIDMLESTLLNRINHIKQNVIRAKMPVLVRSPDVVAQRKQKQKQQKKKSISPKKKIVTTKKSPVKAILPTNKSLHTTSTKPKYELPKVLTKSTFKEIKEEEVSSTRSSNSCSDIDVVGDGPAVKPVQSMLNDQKAPIEFPPILPKKSVHLEDSLDVASVGKVKSKRKLVAMKKRRARHERKVKLRRQKRLKLEKIRDKKRVKRLADAIALRPKTDVVAVEQVVDEVISFVCKDEDHHGKKDLALRTLHRASTSKPVTMNLDNAGYSSNQKMCARRAKARLFMSQPFSSIIETIQKSAVKETKSLSDNVFVPDSSVTSNSWWNIVSTKLVDRSKKLKSSKRPNVVELDHTVKKSEKDVKTEEKVNKDETSPSMSRRALAKRSVILCKASTSTIRSRDEEDEKKPKKEESEEKEAKSSETPLPKRNLQLRTLHPKFAAERNMLKETPKRPQKKSKVKKVRTKTAKKQKKVASKAGKDHHKHSVKKSKKANHKVKSKKFKKKIRKVRKRLVFPLSGVYVTKNRVNMKIVQHQLLRSEKSIFNKLKSPKVVKKIVRRITKLTPKNMAALQLEQMNRKVDDQIRVEEQMLEMYEQMLLTFDPEDYWNLQLDMGRDIEEGDTDEIIRQKRFHRLRLSMLRPPISFLPDRKAAFGENCGSVFINPSGEQCNEMMKVLSPFWKGPMRPSNTGAMYINRNGQRVLDKNSNYKPLNDDYREFYLEDVQEKCSGNKFEKYYTQYEVLKLRSRDIPKMVTVKEEPVEDIPIGVSRRTLNRMKDKTIVCLGKKPNGFIQPPADLHSSDAEAKEKIKRTREVLATTFKAIHETTLIMMQTRDALAGQLGFNTKPPVAEETPKPKPRPKKNKPKPKVKSKKLPTRKAKAAAAAAAVAAAKAVAKKAEAAAKPKSTPKQPRAPRTPVVTESTFERQMRRAIQESLKNMPSCSKT